jgi:peptidoglycan hydrolase-like protein with peptidoglycan-binding domain
MQSMRGRSALIPGTFIDDELDLMELLFEVDRRSPTYIRWIQASLNKVHAAGLTVDGIIGSKTRGAVQAFQRSRGLVADGVVGSKTEAALVAAGASAPPGAGAPVVPGPGPTPVPVPGNARSCPEPVKRAVDRCTGPGALTCPAIPDLLCMQAIEGVPFEYPTDVRSDPVSSLKVVTKRLPNRTQQFVPSVQASLTGFVNNMRRFGMPFEAILTQGSLYCRCISNTNTLSNHSFGDAIDVAGVRWTASGGPPSRLRETIVHNYADPGERALLRRMNACLRLSFATVIDYSYNSAHHDHFHCDNNRGRGRVPRGASTMVFVQEALTHVLGRSVKQTGKLDADTIRALVEFSGRSGGDFHNDRVLNPILDTLFTRVAADR